MSQKPRLQIFCPPIFGSENVVFEWRARDSVATRDSRDRTWDSQEGVSWGAGAKSSVVLLGVKRPLERQMGWQWQWMTGWSHSTATDKTSTCRPGCINSSAVSHCSLFQNKGMIWKTVVREDNEQWLSAMLGLVPYRCYDKWPQTEYLKTRYIYYLEFRRSDFQDGSIRGSSREPVSSLFPA